MYGKYGNYTHALNEAGITTRCSVELDASGVPFKMTKFWDLQGMLQAADQASLIQAMRALETAYSVHGQAAQLLLDDGSTVYQALPSIGSIGGVIITEPVSYPRYDGAEGSTYVTYRVGLRAEYQIDPAGGLIALRWEEVLTITGGGPRFVIIEVRNGPPQKQMVSQATPYRATQTGQGTGWLQYPPFPSPIWAADEDVPNRQLTRMLPTTRGGSGSSNIVEYPIAWSFQYQSVSPLIGNPQPRPF